MLECGSAHFFLLGMQFSINEYSGAEVLLSGLAQLFVFVQDLYVEVVDGFELFISGCDMAENFVLNPAGRCCDWEHALDVEEIVPEHISLVIPIGLYK